MKKNLLLLVLALIGMGGFTACNNDDELLVQEQANTKPVVIRASIGEVSRLALGDSEGGQTKLSWGTGDAFALTIGGNSYTFEWVSGNYFEYNGSGFPETFAETTTITATYPATAAGGLSVQSGTKANVGNYMQMVAELAVTDGQSTTDLNLNFEHQTSVVEIALENTALAGKAVVVDLRTIAEAMYSTPATGDGVLSFDSNDGKLTVYFAVSPTNATIKDWHIGVKDIDGNDYYTATLSEKKLAASKMYKVSKDALTPSYLVSDDGKTVTAHNAIGLYKWAEMATEDLSVNLKLGDNITLPTEGITLTDGLPDKGNWTPVGNNSSTPYKGNIDGNNKTISNMYIVNKTNTANYQGFLGNSDKVTIQNLKFDGAKIVVGQDVGTGSDGGGYTGVISGVSKANFSNCHVTNSTVKCLALGTNSQMVGGLVGQLNAGNNAGKITNSSFSDGTVEGYHSVGGIVGSLRNAQPTYFSSVTKCTAAGTVTGVYGVGGIAGSCYSYIEECTNNATVNGAASGGIVGHLNTYGCVVGCTNNGEINGETSVDSKGFGTGGIVGHIHSETTIGNDTKNYVIGCRNLNAKVTLSDTQRSGGIVGNQKRALSGVYGSYTVKSDVDNAFQSWFGQNPNSATNEGNDVFDSATGDDLTSVAVGAMNTAIEMAFNAMNTTSPKSSYVSKGNYSTYKAYRWLWTEGSGIWPEFKAPVAP